MPATLESRHRIPFKGSPRPTLGVEVEVQIIDPATMNLTSGSTRLLERLDGHPRIKQELTQSTIEVITGVCGDVAEARADLEASFRDLYREGDALGLAFSMAGTHPFAQWRDQDVFPNERYGQLVERIQWPARRLLIYGLHVHVGVASGEKAVAITNALTTYIPHLLALSASSPFVDFEDTGLASTRSKIFEGMPTAGLPFRLANYSDFQRFVNTLIRAGAIQGIREIWWDIRPHPAFGTIEVRVCDCPSTLRETAALTALVQSLVCWLDFHYDEGDWATLLRPWIVRENKWRATRFGLDAEIIVDNEGTQRPLRDELPRLITTIEPFAQRLGCFEELQGCRDLLRHGASYERQRRMGGGVTPEELQAVVRHLSDGLRADVLTSA